MSRLLFTGAFLICLYALAVVIMYFIKKKHEFNYDSSLLSRDVFSVCKGLAITLIMVAHIGNNFGVRYLTPLGSFGVAVFLFCSGYGLQMSTAKKGLRGYWIKRIKTAYVPYLVIEVVGYIFLYDNIKFVDIVKDLLLIDTIHTYGWYMQCLFLYYIAFYFAELLSKKWKPSKYVVLCLVSIAIFVFLDGLFKQQLFSFVLGVICGIYKEKIGALFSKWYIFALSLFCGVGMLGARQLSFIRDGHWIVYNLVYALQAILLAVALVSFVQIFSKKLHKICLIPFALIGIISNEIYLVHAFLVPANPTYLKIVLFFVLVFTICSAIYVIKYFAKKLIFSKKPVEEKC